MRLGFSLAVVWLGLSSAASAADKLPLRDGEYSNKPCDGVPDIMSSIGLHTLTDGPGKGHQSLSPQAEDQEGYCQVGRLQEKGNVYSGSARCESGTRMSLPTGTYRLSYTVLSDSSFMSKGVTYRLCAAHR